MWLNGLSVAAVASSGAAVSTAALSDEGHVFTWGCGRDGRLGHGVAAITNAATPREVPLPEPATAIAMGEYFGLAIGASGAVYSWGRRALGRKDVAAVPVGRVDAAGGLRTAVAIAAGREHAVAVDEAGGAWTWGVGTSYALGHGDKAEATSPRRVTALQGACMLFRQEAILAGASVTPAPTALAAPPHRDATGKRVVAVAAGREHTLFLTAGGEVYAVGTC